MDTRIFTVGRRGAAPAEIRELGRVLVDGGIVAFPTETVYGLAAASGRPDSRQKLLRLKAREEEKPLTLHVADAADVEPLAAPLSRSARRAIRRLWPGPLTLVLPDREGGFTGFRLPDHAVARGLIRAAGAPILATSTNRSGEPALFRGRDVIREFDGRIDAIVDAGPTRHRGPSTVARIDGRRVEILREGVLPADEVRSAAGTSVLFVCTGNLCRSPMAEGILKAVLAEKLRIAPEELAGRGIHIGSAGTGANVGDPATPSAVRCAREYGADLSRHVSRPLTPTAVSAAGRIYSAETRHARVIADFLPESWARVQPLMPDGSDLPDPYGRTEGDYRKTARLIRSAVERIANEILAEEEEE